MEKTKILNHKLFLFYAAPLVIPIPLPFGKRSLPMKGNRFITIYS